ncbi:MAG: CRTAC1 family protein, partial [Bryobacteraceae bacterium]|nr:CRTAC1 family protein [Bryobacteraceae bacterium]
FPLLLQAREITLAKPVVLLIEPAEQHTGDFRAVKPALGEDGHEQAGMGIAIGDYLHTGRPSLVVTNFALDNTPLYRNDGKWDFQDVSYPSGIGLPSVPYVKWGVAFVDLDNDGWPDIFFVTGSVYPEVEKHLPAYPYRTPRVIFRNLGNGRFEELIEEGGPGVAAAHASRGCAFGDFDNDGDLDILIVNLNEPPSLLRNDLGGRNHWLKVKLIGTKSNRSAIGARVTCRYGDRRQVQEVLSQSSFYSVNDPRLHFGLGAVETANLEVRWPSGAVETYAKVAADRIVVIKEGEGIVS